MGASAGAWWGKEQEEHHKHLPGARGVLLNRTMQSDRAPAPLLLDLQGTKRLLLRGGGPVPPCRLGMGPVMGSSHQTAPRARPSTTRSEVFSESQRDDSAVTAGFLSEVLLGLGSAI